MTDLYSNKLADNYMLALSRLFNVPAADTYDIVRIPHWALVDDVWLDIVTACTGDGTLTIGWKGNQETAQPQGFMSNDIAEPSAIGMKRAQKDNLLTFPGKYFGNSGGTVTVTIGGTATALVCRVFVGHSVIQ